MLNFENMTRPEKIAVCRTIRDNLDTLTAIYRDSRDDGPAATVKALSEKIGESAARGISPRQVVQRQRLALFCHTFPHGL